MIAKGDFKFREFKHRNSGTWEVNGIIRSYDEAYILKIDEVTDNGDLYEGQLKVSIEEKDLIKKLSSFKAFDDITIEMYAYMVKDKAVLKIKDVITNNPDADSLNVNQVKEQVKLF